MKFYTVSIKFRCHHSQSQILRPLLSLPSLLTTFGQLTERQRFLLDPT